LKKIHSNRLLDLLIKAILLVLIGWAIYGQVLAEENFEALRTAFLERIQNGGQYWLFLVVVLVPVNWGAENAKWRVLIRGFTDMSWWASYRAILAGISVSLFTPNRIGEYGGRILLVEARHNWKAVIATLVGSFSQLLMLLTFGLVGTIFFLQRFLPDESYTQTWIFWVSFVVILALWYGFFNIRRVAACLYPPEYTKQLRRWFRHLLVLRHYTAKELSKALLFAFLRYLVYTIQYYCMMRFFGLEIPFALALMGIMTLYFLQTSIPLPPVVGILARGELALFIWGFFSDLSIPILATSYGLFLLNLAIPALLGAFFIVQTNVMKSLGYDNKNDEK
jgi:uncharacterized membrane protein YbhN (UPF0104 family)